MLGVGNFGKVGVEVGYFTSDSATLFTSSATLGIKRNFVFCAR